MHPQSTTDKLDLPSPKSTKLATSQGGEISREPNAKPTQAPTQQDRIEDIVAAPRIAAGSGAGMETATGAGPDGARSAEAAGPEELDQDAAPSEDLHARHQLEGRPVSYSQLRTLADHNASGRQLERLHSALAVSAAPTAYHRLVQLNLALALLSSIRPEERGQLYLSYEHHFFDTIPPETALVPEGQPATDSGLWLLKEENPIPPYLPGPETPRHVLVPDLSWLSSHQEAQRQSGYLQGAPRIVIELLSSPSHKRELSARRAIFQEWGTVEYWLIDLPARAVRLYRLQSGERMKSLTRPDALLMSPLLPGFSIELSQLFDPTMLVGDPALRATLQQREQELSQAHKIQLELRDMLADERKSRARLERALSTESAEREKTEKLYHQENDRRIQLEALASVLQHRVEREISQRESAELKLEVEARAAELLRRQLQSATATLDAERAFNLGLDQDKRALKAQLEQREREWKAALQTLEQKEQALKRALTRATSAEQALDRLHGGPEEEEASASTP